MSANPMADWNSFGSLVKRLRIGKNLTTQELAARMNLGTSELSALEDGSRKPSPVVLRSLADILGEQIVREFGSEFGVQDRYTPGSDRSSSR